MITFAAHIATGVRQGRHASILANALVDLSFVGGCTLPALTFAPIIWPRKKILAVCMLSALAGFLVSTGRISLGETLGPSDFYRHWFAVGVQLTLFIVAGVSVMALAAADVWKRRDADSLLLMLWVLGTFIFTGFVNWTINARSVLPLIPAAGILLARRVDALQTQRCAGVARDAGHTASGGGRGIALAYLGRHRAGKFGANRGNTDRTEDDRAEDPEPAG